MSRSSNGVMRSILIVAVLAACTLAGLQLGRLAASRRQDTAPTLPPRSTPDFLTAADAHLPDVQLLGENGLPVGSIEAVGRDGAVVLFLDMDCIPCHVVAQRWNELTRDGSLTVIGITPSPHEAIPEFKHRLAVDFPIYADAAGTYMEDHGVDSVPWELVVARGGRIVDYEGELRAMGQHGRALSALRNPS